MAARSTSCIEGMSSGHQRSCRLGHSAIRKFRWALYEERPDCDAGLNPCGFRIGLIEQVKWNTVATEAYGNARGLLAGVKAKDIKTGEVFDIEVQGPEAHSLAICSDDTTVLGVSDTLSVGRLLASSLPSDMSQPRSSSAAS